MEIQKIEVVTNELVASAYREFYNSTREAQFAGIEYEDGKRALETDTMMAVTSGKIAGKNDLERRAEISKLFAKQIANLEKKEKMYVVAQQKTTLARIYLDYVRDLIRLGELCAETEKHHGQ